MIRCPDNVAPERREVRGGEFSIGRGKDNQWVVADPDRHLSKKHCQFTYGVGEWEVQDFSTNGTFLNQSSDPIGKGASQKLRHGDRVYAEWLTCRMAGAAPERQPRRLMPTLMVVSRRPTIFNRIDPKAKYDCPVMGSPTTILGDRTCRSPPLQECALT